MIICLIPGGQHGGADTALLESLGYQVRVAAPPNGPAPADSELTVVQLPGGHDEACALLRHWRESLPAGHPILALGRWTGGEDIRDLLRAGASDYLTHPCQTRELEARLLILLHATARLNRDLRQRIAETQRVEVLSAMAGSLAHDFNNLLAAILGNAEVALLDSNLSDSTRYSLNQIDRASRHAAELTRQMMLLSGRPSPQLESVQLGELVGEMTEILRASIPKQCRVEIRTEPDLPCIMGEPGQLRQVVMNLLINASEALMPLGGLIRLSARRARRRGEPRVVLDISDSGRGIPLESQCRIFDPFYSTKKAGRGLGLAAVQAIVESHGGEVTVDSEPGQGSTFRLEFPAQAPARGQQLAVIPGPAAGGSGAVLLVETEAAVREAAATLLSRSGFQLLAAANGDEAEQILLRKAGQLHAVVLDLALPGDCGEGLLQFVRSHWPALPVVIWSGYAEEEIRARSNGHPIAATLRKPCHLMELAATLARVLTTPPGAVA